MGQSVELFHMKIKSMFRDTGWAGKYMSMSRVREDCLDGLPPSGGYIDPLLSENYANMIANKKEPTKDDTEKTQWHLIPFKFLNSVARIFMFGAKKYGVKNYLGLEDKRIEDALMRHWYAYLQGESADSDTGESHLAHIICNCLMLMEKKGG